MSRAERLESGVQVALMLGVGAAAGAAALSHVAELAIAHGRPVWEAWSVALVLETMAVSTGLEIRRRRRRGVRPGWVLGALIASVVLSGAAQVAEAERSFWGWTTAAVPMAGFLVLAKIAMAAGDAAGPSAAAVPVRSAARPDEPSPSARPRPARPRPEPATEPGTVPAAVGTAPDVDELLLVGQAVAHEIADAGGKLTRDALVDGVRARGRQCSNRRGSELLRALRAA